MACIKWNICDSKLRFLFSKLGYAIGYQPLPFVIVPLILVLASLHPFISGFGNRFNTQVGSIDLFTPENTMSQINKRKMARLFPDGGYFSDRTLLAPNLLIVIVSPKNTRENVFEDQFIKEYQKLRYKLEQLEVHYNESSLSYSNLCNEQTGSHCNEDHFISIWKIHIQTSFLPVLTYPVINISLPNDVNRSKYIGPLFGDVDTDVTGEIVKAKYVKMIFDLPLSVPSTALSTLTNAWKKELENFKSPILEVLFWSPQQFRSDMAEIGRRTTRFLPFLVSFLVGFSLLSCCMADMVLSKPLLAISGIFSASCGIICSHALLFLCGVELIQIAMIVPFLVLSIGVDDMFVILNVWRKTDSRLSVPERLGHTYRDSAVSIVVTTATDAVVFVVGVGSSFPAIRIFCIHCFVSIIIVFLFQVILFGAFMAITGYRESNGRHCLTYRKVPQSERYACCFGLFRSQSNRDNKAYRARPWPSVYFAQYHNVLLLKPWIQGFLILSYPVIVGLSVFSIQMQMNQGLEVSKLVPYNTETYRYLTIYERYFFKYSTLAEVVIAEPLDYYDTATRNRLLDAIGELERTNFTRKSKFWLREFLDFSQSFNIGTRRDFYDLLFYKFLPTKAFGRFSNDLQMITDGDRVLINTSRLFLPLINVGHQNRSVAMHLLQNIAENIQKKHPGLELLIYDVSYPLADQYDTVPYETVMNIAIAGAAILFISLLFIPNLIGCLTVGFTVIGINIDVVGLLALWDVNLDIISEITILLSIGFSVDFSAHITYHFYHADGDDAEKRLQYSLETVGWPILQSTLSTLLGVVTMAGVQAYVTETFLKTVLLVMLVGIYHGLFVLPATLVVLHKISCYCNDNANSQSSIIHEFVPNRAQPIAPQIAVVHPMAKGPPSIQSSQTSQWMKCQSCKPKLETAF